jgi:preflagellin peptidase FlaK
MLNIVIRQTIMIETITLIDTVRFITGSLILLIASYSDIKTRKASNILWIVMGAIGIVLLVTQYFTDGIKDILYLIFIPIMIFLMYLFFQIRLIFGGADAKAIMALAILVPVFPDFFGYPLKASIMPFSWIVFSNSILIFLFIPLGLFFLNIFKKNMQLPYCFLGYKMSIEKAKEKYVWPLEKLVDGVRKFSYIPKNFDVKEDYKIFEENGIREIWVTPKIPFMIPLLVGFLCAFFLGDMLFYIMSLFL